MKRLIIGLLLFVISFDLMSQNLPIITDTSYTATNRMTFIIGQDIKVGQDRSFEKINHFAHIYSQPWSFPRQLPLNPVYAGKKLKIKKIRTVGNDKKGYKVILVCGAGELQNYWIEIEDAIKNGEVFVPLEFRKNK
jgi:hypothetical protein